MPSLVSPTHLVMKDYLTQLGVGTQLLSNEEKEFLDRNGYLNLGKILPNHTVRSVMDRINELMALEGELAGQELAKSSRIKFTREAGVNRLADLVNKGSIFDLFYTTPRVLSAIAHVLAGDMKLSSLNYRAALPGEGLQKLHVDWETSVPAGEFKVCNAIWLLDDFTRKNGSTRIVPGSHNTPHLPDELLEDPMASHPDEILVEAPAGTVVVFNSHTWHGGTKNRTNKPRRAIHSYFCQRDQPQQTVQSRFITQETRSRLNAATQYLLDI